MEEISSKKTMNTWITNFLQNILNCHFKANQSRRFCGIIHRVNPIEIFPTSLTILFIVSDRPAE